MGHSKFYLSSRKFISADGGLARVVWMPKALKEELGEMLVKTTESLGLEDFLNKIADETVAQTEEEVLAYMQKVDHPALTLAPMF